MYEYSSELYDDPVALGRFFKSLREKYGWSRRIVGKKLGLNSETSVMNIEVGKNHMRVLYVARFCEGSPDKLTVPIFYAMFEAKSIHPPCRCICHYDRDKSTPGIYSKDGQCQICMHKPDDCIIINGMWFEHKWFTDDVDDVDDVDD